MCITINKSLKQLQHFSYALQSDIIIDIELLKIVKLKWMKNVCTEFNMAA